jgi:hypothetical protein
MIFALMIGQHELHSREFSFGFSFGRPLSPDAPAADQKQQGPNDLACVE